MATNVYKRFSPGEIKMHPKQIAKEIKYILNECSWVSL